ncbi:MAG: hypothetical protein ABH864_07170 [archaeon]
MKKRRRRGLSKEHKKIGFVSNFIFFLNVFIAALIITGAWLLIETEFGQSAMIFGFLMLCISVVMKAVRWW